MRLLDFVPIKLTLLLVLGVLLGYYFPLNVHLVLGLVIFFPSLLGVVFYYEKKTTSTLFGVITALTTITLGIFIMLRAQPINQASHYSRSNTIGAVPWELKIKEVLKTTSFSERYIASVISQNGTPTTGKVLLSLPLDTLKQDLNVDDEIITFTGIEKLNAPLNPHQFDYKSYLSKLGVYHQIRLNAKHYLKKENPSRTLLGIAAQTRNHIIQKLKQYDFGADELAVIQALLLGQRNDISNKTYSDYKDAGAVHILALSGLHIGVLLLIINFLLRPLEYLPKGKVVKLILTLIFLWGFAFVAGLSPSIIRACTMFTFIAYALYLNRPSNNFNILSLSILFILLFIDPNLLFQVGFQMSYAAVFVIFWMYPLLQKFWFPKNKIIRYFWQLLSVSIAAQLGVLPISLFYFHQFPSLFFVSNLLIVPFLGLILGSGIVVIVLALLDSLPNWIVFVFDKIIATMNRIIEWVAAQEAFIFRAISLDGIQLCFSYLIIITLAFMLSRSTFKRMALFLICLIGFQSWTFYLAHVSSTKQEVIVPHVTKNSIILNRNGTHLEILSNHQTTPNNFVQDYEIGERIDSISIKPLANGYRFKNESILILDSTGIYSKEHRYNSILITQSPKLNLDRLIESVAPKVIIVDGSNYKSYIKRWRATCLKQKIPFHYTGEKGAYIF
ncbi:ComEC/Rec2 family competence protein [Maribacter sp. 2210JD10-5]|uniref:ComEC/Rec2 family competence protein n=1 Tax=Maribacter sp. 2210JD10-5 TaxID=3386272 RepID=UPI0039BCC230